MPARATLSILALTVPAALTAQTIDYDAGEYQYAETPAPAPARPDDAVTWSVPADVEVRPAERVIEARRAPAAVPVFVARPVVQGATVVAAPVHAYRVAAPPAPLVYAAPVPSAYPAGGASRVIYSGSSMPTVAPAGAYAVELVGALPPGAQIVAFDRESWLADCRARLTGYAPEDRARVIATMGGAPGAYDCEGFLASYMARAANGTLPLQPAYGQSYMLLTVVPQQPVALEYTTSAE